MSRPEVERSGVMKAWQVKCLGGGDIYEYLREARLVRGMGRDRIARELEEKAHAAGHKGFKVAPSSVWNALADLGLKGKRTYV